MSWIDTIGPLSSPLQRRLLTFPEQVIAKRAIQYRAGDAAQGIVVVLSGRIEAHLTGPSGHEIRLYAVEPGQSCVQTALGHMAGEPYSCEALAANLAP